METLRAVWLFIQKQILGIKWCNEVIGNALNALGVDITSRWGGSIQFLGGVKHGKNGSCYR